MVGKVGQMDPERIVERFFMAEGATPPADLLKALTASPQTVSIVRRRVMENLIEPSLKEVEGTLMASGRTLETRFRKFEPGLKKLLKPDQLGAFERLVHETPLARLAACSSGVRRVSTMNTGIPASAQRAISSMACPRKPACRSSSLRLMPCSRFVLNSQPPWNLEPWNLKRF